MHAATWPGSPRLHTLELQRLRAAAWRDVAVMLGGALAGAWGDANYFCTTSLSPAWAVAQLQGLFVELGWQSSQHST